MDEAVAGPSRRINGNIAGDNNVENASHLTIAGANASSPWAPSQARAKGSKASLPYLHFNDVKLILPEEGDSDDDEQNHSATDALYCMYCGDISSKKNIRRHINSKHEGTEPGWTLQSTYSKKKAGRVTALARQKPYIKVLEIAAETDITDEEVRRGKRVRTWKNCMKAKKARDAASNPDRTEDPSIQNQNLLQSQEEQDAIANGGTTEDHNAYVPIKPVNEKAFREEMKDVLSIAALIEKTMSFKVHREEGYIECVPCKTKHSYNFGLGEAFERGKMHKKFGDLKNVVLHHIFKSVSHDNVTNGNYRVTSEEDKLAGKIIGGRIYGFVKSGTKHFQFKNELYKSKLDGSKIGSINHSEYTLSKMLICLYECHMAYVTKEMNAPNPVTGSSYITITADKITLHNKTYHCIGLYYVTKNGLENVFLKVLENQGGSGKRLAEEMVKATVDTLGISRDELGKRLVCVATDGQYIRNNVDDRMNEILGNRGDFRTFAWDIGHLIELAAKKSREQFDKKDLQTIKEHWLKNVFVISRTISTYYRTPKNMQRLRGVASKKLQQTNIDALEDFPEVEEFFESFYSPLTFKKFSDTRWAQFTKTTFYAIIRNFRAMRIDLGPSEPVQTEETVVPQAVILPREQAESMEDDETEESEAVDETEETQEVEETEEARVDDRGKTKEQLRNWAKLANAEFILGINGMMDIYEIVTSMSLNAQRSKAFVWDTLAVHQELMNKITKLKDDFPKPVGVEERPYLRPNFSKAALELQHQQSYRSTKIQRLSVPILVDDDDCDKDKDTFVMGIEAVILDISTKLGNYTAILITKLNEEMIRVPKVMLYTKDAFNIPLIRARRLREAPESLKPLFNCSKEFGIYADPELSFEDFETEYYSFIDYVKSMDSENDSLYIRLLFNNQINTFPNILQLLAASAARSSCEGIIESYGSIMKERLHHRERLGELKYNSELFLHINGPAIGKADTLITAGWTRFFRGRAWHFYPRSNPSRLKTFIMSKALDPLQDRTSKFDPMPEDYDLGFTYP